MHVTLVFDDIEVGFSSQSYSLKSGILFLTMANKTKRKNEFTDGKVEPAVKALKKQDIIVQFKALQDKYESLEKHTKILEEEKKKHIESILLLEETIKILEKRSAQKTSVGVQTEDEQRLWCIECEYPAEDLYDLGEHMYEVHAEDNTEYEVSCHHCGNFYKTKGDLMIHSKRAHPEKVKPCRNFLEGTCDFSDNDCWYKHDETERKSPHSFTCSICKKVFKLRSDYMSHRKKKHIEIVPKCRSAETCHFGISNCWYNHSELNDSKEENMDISNEDNNKKILEKLFDMVEKMTERIVQLENKKT